MAPLVAPPPSAVTAAGTAAAPVPIPAARRLDRRRRTVAESGRAPPGADAAAALVPIPAARRTGPLP